MNKLHAFYWIIIIVVVGFCLRNHKVNLIQHESIMLIDSLTELRYNILDRKIENLCEDI